jgi:hypothetical protein
MAPNLHQISINLCTSQGKGVTLLSSISVNGHEVKPEAKPRILGVYVDPKLNWKEHIKEQVEKGTAAFEALARLATSIFGPSMRKARLIYTPTVCPGMMYGAQVRGIQEGPQKPMPCRH